jgi:hypothetical protein
MPEMALPIRLADFVADQPVDGLRIGDAQQRLGEAQERHALRRGQCIFVQKGVDPAFAEALAADGGDEGTRSVGDPVAHVGGYLAGGEDVHHRFGLVEPAPLVDRGAQWLHLRRHGSEHDVHPLDPCRPPPPRDVIARASRAEPPSAFLSGAETAVRSKERSRARF